ncbi:MAG: radical SAM protein [Thermoplasmata archaeon]|nr:radical SAM protein [Thermoplasmata archaeon]
MKITEKKASTACSPSKLPGLDWALNPYRGCQHACVYCYSPDILHLGKEEEWGSAVEVKKNLPVLLAKGKKKITGPIGLGTVTDPYQPVEDETFLTRFCLEQLVSSSVCIQTKGDIILRDLDILKRIKNLEVGITITTMDQETARILEPGAPPPENRIKALAKLSKEGIRTWVFLGPVIPGINDSYDSLGKVIKAAKEAGAGKIIYDKLRLKPLVRQRMEKKFGLSKASKMFQLAEDREWVERVFIDIEVLCDDAGLVGEKAF